MYKVYDDLGVLCEGTSVECRRAMLDWLGSDEATKLYTKSELKEGIKYFENYGATSFMGFTIERLKDE